MSPAARLSLLQRQVQLSSIQAAGKRLNGQREARGRATSYPLPVGFGETLQLRLDRQARPILTADGSTATDGG